MAKKSFPVALSLGDQAKLERWELVHGTPQHVVLLCRIVLGDFAGEGNQSDSGAPPSLSAHGEPVTETGAGSGERTSLRDCLRSRAQNPLWQSWHAIINATLRTMLNGMTHWSRRIMERRKKSEKTR